LEQSMFLCSPYGGILYILHSSFFKWTFWNRI
jgi:hypothetical protein